VFDARTIDRIRQGIEEGSPHVGAETEGILTDPSTLEVVHDLEGCQPTQAVKRWIARAGGEAGRRAAELVTPDVPETTIEANRGPLRNPRSTAAAQRLMAILIDTALVELGSRVGRGLQLLHGAVWRPPRLTSADVSRAASLFKSVYYEFQIGRHGDKVGAAAGDHVSFSAPWLEHLGATEISRKMIEMTGRMRLVGGALSIGLSAASPLYFGANGGGSQSIYGTSLTPWASARLGHVWPGRTIMDVSGLYRDAVSFRRTMARFAETGALLSGRDVWLMARAQPAPVEPERSLSEVCAAQGMDLETDDGRSRARELVLASFRHGPNDEDNPLHGDPAWQAVEAWRQDLLRQLIRAPRNRVEIRTLETPPAFVPDSPGGTYSTPYEYLKSVHAFLELLFVYLSENPPSVDELEYGELELQAAKSNEQAVLLRGLDAQVYWIPTMRSMSARELLRRLLVEMRPLAEALERTRDLAIVERIAEGIEHPPAARIRREVATWYDMDVHVRHNAQMLPSDDYPRELLARSRRGMELEIEQIEEDLPTVPLRDRRTLSELLDLVKARRRPVDQGTSRP